eukprot:6061312-Amphidinium_carterae.1
MSWRVENVQSCNDHDSCVQHGVISLGTACPCTLSFLLTCNSLCSAVPTAATTVVRSHRGALNLIIGLYQQTTCHFTKA